MLKNLLVISKKIIRDIYPRYFQIYHEKLKFLFLKMKNEKEYLNFFYNKNCLEIGGPSFFFRNCLRVYNVLVSVDNVNYSMNNIWKLKSELGKKNIYNFKKSKEGIQYIAQGTNLESINKTYDTIISSHVLEHSANPLKFILELKKKLNYKGVLLTVVPQGKFTFDNKRPVTSISHLIEDYNNNTQEYDQTHIQENILLHDFSMNKQMNKKTFIQYANNNFQTRIIHHHVFDENLIKEVYDFCGLRILLLDCVVKNYPSIIILGEKN